MPESSRDLTNIIMSSISSLDIISVVVPDPNIFLCIPAPAADAAPVNPRRIKTLSAKVSLNFVLEVILFLVMDQVIHQILLIESF